MIKIYTSILLASLFLLSCFEEPRLPDFKPNELACQIIGSQCHRTIKIVKKSRNIPQHLSVTTHSPKVSYPGIVMPWLKGDISGFDTITILFNNPDSTKRFELFLWDEVGSLYYENRFNITSKYKEGPIDTVKIPLSDGLKTITGRKLNLENIQTAVFYTSRSKQPFTFQLYDIILK